MPFPGGIYGKDDRRGVSHQIVNNHKYRKTDDIMNNRFFRIVTIFLCAVCVLGITACAGQTKEDSSYSTTDGNTYDPDASVTKYGFYFDTEMTVTLYGTEDDTFIKGCFDIAERYEELFSRTIETSEVSQINSAEGDWVEVSDETLELIGLGIYYGELSGGLFDITVGRLSTLWDIDNNPGIIPEDEDIATARDTVDYTQIDIDGNKVRLKNKDAMIDLGGIAKGYLADKMKEYLLENGITSALLNLGGNVLAVGTKPDGSDFNIGVQKPFYDGEVSAALAVSDLSVVSSGVYERYFELDGRIYHHILDIETGYPYDNGLYGVTIISGSSVEGDALSTIVFAMGLEKGMEFVEGLDGVDAVFITDEYEIISTNDELINQRTTRSFAL